MGRGRTGHPPPRSSWSGSWPRWSSIPARVGARTGWARSATTATAGSRPAPVRRRAPYARTPGSSNAPPGCDEAGCVALEHLTVGTQAENVAQMHRRGRGWRRHTGTADLRGPAGRARAIRAALAAGWDEAAFTAAVAAGDPFCRQLALPVLAQFSRTWPRPQGSGVGHVRENWAV